jgi:hypothetical protein
MDDESHSCPEDAPRASGPTADAASQSASPDAGARINQALIALQRLPGFSDARCRIFAETESFVKNLHRTPPPRPQAREWFDSHARYYADLITDAESREVYFTVLNDALFPEARTMLLGFPNCEPATADGRALVASLEEALRYWQNEAFVRTSSNRPAIPPAARGVLPRPQRWEEIELCFIGDHDVEVRIGAGSQQLSYKAIAGFEDRRTGNPSQQWAMLRAFAMLPGCVMPNARTNKLWHANQKKIERISEALRKHFGLTDDPFPYQTAVGYRCRLKLRMPSETLD